MPSAQLAELAERFAGELVEEFGAVSVTVPAQQWLAAASYAREHLSASYFDMLCGVDEGADGFAVVVHLWSTDRREHLLLRTLLPAEDPRLASLTGLFAGAAWHERETWEMFGIVFDGHPNLVPLLLPDGFVGHPLRKDFVLAARVVKPWPGAKEPGGDRPRRPVFAPGVPEGWGAPAQDPGQGSDG